MKIEDQLNRIRVYFLTNPQKRKTAAGIGRCITSWLGRVQDGGGQSSPSSRTNSFPQHISAGFIKAPPGKYSGIGIVLGGNKTQESKGDEQ